MRRALAKLAGARVRRRKIPRQVLPHAARLQYNTRLVAIQKTIGDLLDTLVIDQLPDLLRQASYDRGGLRQDSAADDILRIFSNFRVLFANAHPAGVIESDIATVAGSTDTQSFTQHQRQMKAGLGIELIVPEPFKQAVLEGFIAENIDLVETLHQGQIDRFRAIVNRGVQGGLRVETIRDQLLHELGIAQSRASLLARDQTLRLFGELTELRQTNVGIEEYDWDTSDDSRVRPRHGELHGTRQRWDDPPIVQYATAKRPERRAHPGMDYQCRCQALPVIPETMWAP